ncbi:MAG: ABC transporter permease [Alphaproteobacteria bacterium]
MAKSLARANLGHQWKLFVAAISILMLSGCMIYVACGVMMSNMRSFSALERSYDVDLYIVANRPKEPVKRGVMSFGAGTLPSDLLYQISEYAEVQTVDVPIRHQFFAFVLVNGKSERISFLVLDMDAEKLTTPVLLGDAEKRTLSQVGNIILTKATAKKIKANLNDVLPARDAGVDLFVAGVSYGELARANLMGRSSNNFISLETAQLIDPNTNPPNMPTSVASFLVKLKKGVNVYEAQARLNHYLKPYRAEAILPAQKQRGTGWGFIKESKALQGFFVVGIFAILIPLFIVVQTLRSAIMAQRIQFATLRALGVPVWRLASIAMEQALWVGILGAAMSYCLALFIRLQLYERDILMYLPTQYILNISAAIVFAAMFAGLVSLIAIFKTRPQELLR